MHANNRIVPNDKNEPPPDLFLHWAMGIDKAGDWSKAPDSCVTDGTQKSSLFA